MAAPAAVPAAVPAAAPAPLNPVELRLQERARYLTALQKYDQRLWDPTDQLLKAEDITYGINPERNKQYDLSPHLIMSAHISTAMQGSIVPGVLEPGIRAGPIMLENTEGQRLAQSEPFVARQKVTPGIGDANTDQMLQKALKQYLTKGEEQTRAAITFNDRAWRGQ